jgi:hypothetical protein
MPVLFARLGYLAIRRIDGDRIARFRDHDAPPVRTVPQGIFRDAMIGYRQLFGWSKSPAASVSRWMAATVPSPRTPTM